MKNNPRMTGILIDRAIRIVPKDDDQGAVSRWCRQKGIPDAFWLYDQSRDEAGVVTSGPEFIFVSGDESSRPPHDLVDKVEPTLARDPFVKDYEKLCLVIFADFVFAKSKTLAAFPPERRIDTSEHSCIFKFSTRKEAEQAVTAFLAAKEPSKQVRAATAFYQGVDISSLAVDWSATIPIGHLEEACTQTGVSPHEKGVRIGRLTTTWNRHAAGAIVIVGRFPDINADAAVVDIEE